MWSPGRPTTARRKDRVQFWEGIASGMSTEEAAAVAGVSSAVGARWFRQGGGMPSISLKSVTNRYLSFAEREEIAILQAQRIGVREIARRTGRSPSTISRELRRNAVDPGLWSLDYRAIDRSVARRAPGEPTQGGQAGGQPDAARLRAGPAFGG